MKQNVIGADRVGRWMHDFDRKLSKARERQAESNRRLMESRKEQNSGKSETGHTLGSKAQDQKA